MMDEEWRPVVGFEGYYEVSDQGRVRSIDRVVQHGALGPVRRKGRVLAENTMRSGHKRARLNKDGKQHSYYVHRLVLEAFRGPCPPGHECCHGPGGPGDNRLGNLRWDTKSANTLDRVTDGTHNMTRKTHCKNRHPLSGDNLYRDRNGNRECRTCRRAASARYARRRRWKTT